MIKLSAFVLSGLFISQMAFAQAVTPTSVVVCRDKQCAAASQSMTREYLYNQLVSFFENNAGQNVLFCEADQIHRVCYENGIRFKTQVGLTPAVATIESAKVLRVKTVKNSPATDIAFDYDISLNETKPRCEAALTRLRVSSADTIRMESGKFDCKFSSLGKTALNTMFAVDYIDFDYGLIGAHYVIGASQASKGGAEGYMLMRFSSLADVDNSFTQKDKAELEKLKIQASELKRKVKSLKQDLRVNRKNFEDESEDKIGQPVYVEKPSESDDAVPSGTVQIFPVDAEH